MQPTHSDADVPIDDPNDDTEHASIEVDFVLSVLVLQWFLEVDDGFDEEHCGGRREDRSIVHRVPGIQ